MAHAPRPRTVHWWPTLGIMVGGLAVAMSQGSLNVAIPSMMSSLGTDLDRIQWVQTGYGIAQAVLIPAVGGQGGGVLSEWLVEAALLDGHAVHGTSIPGVAQRTGSTTYYVEIATGPAAEVREDRRVREVYLGQ